MPNIREPATLRWIGLSATPSKQFTRNSPLLASYSKPATWCRTTLLTERK
jgi:hypothetical protein